MSEKTSLVHRCGASASSGVFRNPHWRQSAKGRAGTLAGTQSPRSRQESDGLGILNYCISSAHLGLGWTTCSHSRQFAPSIGGVNGTRAVEDRENPTFIGWSRGERTSFVGNLVRSDGAAKPTSERSPVRPFCLSFLPRGISLHVSCSRLYGSGAPRKSRQEAAH